MGFLTDLLYFGPALGPRRAAGLARAKLAKANRKRKTAAALAHGEADHAVLKRLGLPDDAEERRVSLVALLEPAVPVGLPLDPARVPVEEIRARADAVLAGRQILFGRPLEVGWPPRWDWRWDGLPEAADFAADIRSTWELMRLQGILPLARAARLLDGPEGDRYAAGYVDALLAFLRDHPGPQGPAWSSALEVGLRLVALVQGLPLVAHREAFAASDVALLKLVDRHARWLAADLSLDKVVRGNHLLGELAGLLAVGRLFPAAREAWWGGLDPAALLEAEIDRQFHPDGANVEQSLTYEKFILEFLLVAAEVGRLCGAPFSDGARDRLARSAAHLATVTAPDGALPRVGDCDSGRGADWDAGDPHRPDEVLARSRAVFGEAEAPGAGGPVVLFPDAGHAVARGAGGDYLFLRGGPFGWGIPGPASHSHADLLAPVLYLAGEAVLVDPGVYGYRVPGPLRDELRNWAGHNAVTFSRPRGPRPAGTFRWRDLDLSAELAAEASADGFALAGSVRWGRDGGALQWHRSVIYNELERSWTLVDRFPTGVSGPVTWGFHFAPGVQVRPVDDTGQFRLALRTGTMIDLEFDPVGSVQLEPGWAAPAYGDRIDTVVLRRRLDSVPAESKVRLRPA